MVWVFWICCYVGFPIDVVCVLLYSGVASCVIRMLLCTQIFNQWLSPFAVSSFLRYNTSVLLVNMISRCFAQHFRFLPSSISFTVSMLFHSLSLLIPRSWCHALRSASNSEHVVRKWHSSSVCHCLIYFQWKSTFTEGPHCGGIWSVSQNRFYFNAPHYGVLNS